MRVVSFNIAHDSSVCSLNNGKIEFFCKEERLSKIKRDKHPFKSLELFYNQNFGKVDHFLYLTPSNNENHQYSLYEEYIKKKFNCELENFSSLQHHLCHASIAFYNSGFEECLVFVIDRNGSIFFYNNHEIARETESVFKCSYPDDITAIYKSFCVVEDRYKITAKNELCNYYSNCQINVNNPFGIVKVYESATTLIGQSPLENGKTMGLSSYGEDKEYEKLFLNGSAIRNYFSEVLTNTNDLASCFYGYEDKILGEITKDNYQFYANKAKHVQLETQNEILDLINKYVNETGIKNVCLVGGYALNVVANNFYIKNLPEVNFYFEPVADDTGITLGASMLKWRQETKNNEIKNVSNNFYHYYDYNDKINIGKESNILDICNLLIGQKSISIFDGAPEAGPRALGHRSILFDPRNKNGKDIINLIKNREWYRPFAGIILETEFKNYFYTLNLKKSKYMTISFDCKTGVCDYVPAIIHTDNTCRIQTVSEKDGFIYELLKNFFDMTGCPMLLNTSFNLAGNPLVQTKSDAVEVLKNSSLDAIFFVDQSILVEKFDVLGIAETDW